MFELIRGLIGCFSERQKKQILTLQVIIVAMSFVEVVGIASIAPFMALVSDISLLKNNETYKFLFEMSGLSNANDFLIVSGVLVLFALCCSAIFSIFSIWISSKYGLGIGVEFSNRLFRLYLNRDWSFHLNNNSSLLTKQIATESGRVTNGIIIPLLQLNSRFILVLFILIGIFYINPWVAFFGVILFFSLYFLIYNVVRNRLKKHGGVISEKSAARFKLMSEGFGGIKEIIISDKSDFFVKKFENAGLALVRAQASNTVLVQVPRYVVELIAFTVVVFLLIFLTYKYDGVVNKILPEIALYALAGFKLLPALQQIYSNIASIKTNTPAFENIKNDLIIKGGECGVFVVNENISKDINDYFNITLKDVSFDYAGRGGFLIDRFNIDIPVNSKIGIVGESGAGKSTLIDLIIGLVKPTSGRLYLDDEAIDAAKIKSYRSNIGFVPQNIFLTSASIAENIAFGVECSDIDIDRINVCVELANLLKFIEAMPEGVFTKVGERGVQLSGGQRQRLGIARALYNDPKIVVFDEATSALDGITEKAIVKSINDISESRTIIVVAHRLNTIKNCDLIILMRNGSLVDKGSFDDLYERNEYFRKLAASS